MATAGSSQRFGAEYPWDSTRSHGFPPGISDNFEQHGTARSPTLPTHREESRPAQSIDPCKELADKEHPVSHKIGTGRKKSSADILRRMMAGRISPPLFRISPAPPSRAAM